MFELTSTENSQIGLDSPLLEFQDERHLAALVIARGPQLSYTALHCFHIYPTA